jgi:hypothetical protein
VIVSAHRDRYSHRDYERTGATAEHSTSMNAKTTAHSHVVGVYKWLTQVQNVDCSCIKNKGAPALTHQLKGAPFSRQNKGAP